MDMNRLLIALLFGCVGMGFLVYGKKEQKGIALLSGFALCGMPYFIPNMWFLIPIGVLFVALPFFVRY